MSSRIGMNVNEGLRITRERWVHSFGCQKRNGSHVTCREKDCQGGDDDSLAQMGALAERKEWKEPPKPHTNPSGSTGPQVF